MLFIMANLFLMVGLLQVVSLYLQRVDYPLLPFQMDHEQADQLLLQVKVDLEQEDCLLLQFEVHLKDVVQ